MTALTSAEPIPAQTTPVRWGMVWRSSVKGFGINLVILTGLHPILPLVFLAPFITGLITGGRQAMTRWEGFLLGAWMGVWMTLLVVLIAGGLVIAMALRLLPAHGMDMMLFT